MALTYLDSQMIEIPAAIATLSTQNLTADNFFVTSINANSIATETLNASTIFNNTLNNENINTVNINSSDLNSTNAQINNSLLASTEITDAIITNATITDVGIIDANITNLIAGNTFTNGLTSTNVITNFLSALSGTFNELNTKDLYVENIFKNLNNVLYVSNTGSDTNSGTNMFNALKTIKKACEIAHNARVAANNNPNVRFTIFVNTGDYTENNPVYVPPNASIIGDNLRRVNIRPLNRQEDIFWVDNSTYIWGVTFRSHFNPSAAVAFPDATNPRLSAIAFKNYSTPSSGWLRPYITTSPYTQGSSSITSGLSSSLQSIESQVINNSYTDGEDALNVVNNCFNAITDTIFYGAGSVNTYTGADTSGTSAATALISLNTEFVKKEASSFIILQYPSFAVIPNLLTNYETTIANVLNAVNTDIAAGTNSNSIQLGETLNSTPQSQIPLIIATIQFAQRLVRHIIKNELIPVLEAGMGMRVDGSKVEGFLRSMVLDSYTQFNENGKGIYILNNGYAQLVSIFTICCNEGITCESGGVCSISNSNCSFGLSGIVARGKSPTPILSGTIIGTITAPDTPLTTKIVVMSGVQGLDVYPNSHYYPAFFNNPAIGIDTRKISFEPYDNLVFTNQTGNDSPLYTILGNPTLTSINGTPGHIIEIIEQTPVSTLVPGNSAAFFLRSTAYASSHTFEFIGSGVILRNAVPSLGGKANIDNEVVFADGGAVFYTSTNQAGDFYIGKEFRVVQATGTIEGDTFKRSILTLVSPLNLALGE